MSEEAFSQDVEETESSAVENSEYEGSQPSEENEGESEAPAPVEVKPPPLHEHPRFREVTRKAREVEERNKRLEERVSQYEKQLQEFMEQSTPKEKDEIESLLEQADPRFAKDYLEMRKRMRSMDEMEERLAQFQEQEVQRQRVAQQQKVEDTIASLYKENEVPEPLQSAYRTAMEKVATEMAQDNPDIGVKDLPKIFDTVHKKYSEWLDSIKRADRKTYVADKKTDGPAPAKQAVQPSKPPKEKSGPVDREELLRDIARSAVSKSRADHDV